MAVSKDDLLIKIDASTVDAVKSIKTLEDVFGGLGMQVVKANAAVDLALKSFEIFKAVVEKISEPFKEALHASIEYEASLNKLRNSLKLTGQFSDDILKRFEDFGATMEMNTTLTQEQAYEMLSLAKVVGVTDEQAMQMVQTAKDLATVTGKDVNDSFRALQGSLRGNSRELIAIDPTLKKFGASAFMSGEAIDYLSEKLDGFAAASAKGFKGVTAQAKNFRDEIARNIGDVLAVAFDIKGTEEFKRAMYLNILKTVEEIKPRLIEFAEGVRDIKRELVSGIVEAARSFGEAMATVGRVIAVIDFKTVAASIVVLTVALTAMVISMKADAVLVFIANLQALAVTLIAFSKVAIAASIPVGIFALKLIGISAVIGTVMVAVDFFNKNGIKPLVAGFTSLVGKIEEIIGKFMQFVGLFQAGGKIIADGWRLQNKGAQEFSKIEMGDGLKSTIDKINEMRDAWKGSGVAAKETEDAAKKIKGAFAGRNIVDPAAQEAYLQALNTIEQKTAQIRLEAERSGLTQVEIIERQLEAMLKAIDAEKERIKISKQFSDVQKKNLMGALDDQKNAAQGEAAAKTANAPGQEYEQAIIAGKSMTNDITKAFQSGTMGMVTGMLGAVDAFVGAAQAVVDFIPGLLDKIANLFNSITDLPNKILTSFGKVIDSITNLISNFIPNLLKAIPQIMKAAVKFLVEGLPKAFGALFSVIPELVVQLIDAIPDFVTGLVQSSIEMMPMIAIAFVEKIIPQLPRVAIAIVRVMAIEIPKAIVKGIVNGVKSVMGAIQNGFKGIKIFDAQDLQKNFDDIKKLTGSTSDLFSVKDLTGSLTDQAQSQADQLAQSIKDGMQWAIDELIKAWRWIYDVIIMPIVNAFKTVFNWVYDGFNKVFLGVQNIFTEIANFLRPIFDAFSGAFKGSVDLLKPVGDIFKQAADIITSAFGPFIEAVNALKNINIGGLGGGGGGGGFLGEVVQAAINPVGALNKKLKFKNLGGPVYASTGMLMTPRGTDTIPAMLAPGEFVMSSGAVKSFGLDAMRSLNSGKIPSSSAVYNNEFNIKIEAKGNVDEAFVKSRLMSVIKEELRRASLDGERLLSSGGVR